MCLVYHASGLNLELNLTQRELDAMGWFRGGGRSETLEEIPGLWDSKYTGYILIGLCVLVFFGGIIFYIARLT